MFVRLVVIVTDDGPRGRPPVATAFVTFFRLKQDAERAVRNEVVSPIHSVTSYLLPEHIALAFEMTPDTVRQLVEEAG